MLETVSLILVFEDIIQVLNIRLNQQELPKTMKLDDMTYKVDKVDKRRKRD